MDVRVENVYATDAIAVLFQGKISRALSSELPFYYTAMTDWSFAAYG